MTKSALLDSLAINPEGFIFSPRTGESFTANQTAIEVLRALQKGIEPEEIITLIAETYEAPKTDIADDLRDFMDHLRALNIFGRA